MCASSRLLANAIDRRGVPAGLWTLRVFGRHWPLWKSSRTLHVAIDVLGCWDTVGSFGLAKNLFGIPFQKINLLKDLSVPISVTRAWHMVALDETRDSFEPTLMEPDPTSPGRITEVWFPGNHANVGGGYATDNLSDVTLDFLLRRVSSGYAWTESQTVGDEEWGIYLEGVKKGLTADTGVDNTTVLDPNPLGQIRHASGPMYTHAPRKLPVHAVIDDSVFERLSDSQVVYAPQSLFDLNQQFAAKRTEIETEVARLIETDSLEPEASKKIVHWSARRLSILRWSSYTVLDTRDGRRMEELLDYRSALVNPPATPGLDDSLSDSATPLTT